MWTGENVYTNTLFRYRTGELRLICGQHLGNNVVEAHMGVMLISFTTETADLNYHYYALVIQTRTIGQKILLFQGHFAFILLQGNLFCASNPWTSGPTASLCSTMPCILKPYERVQW